MTAPQLAPGTVVGNKYSVVSILGFGGSSATYHAVGSDGREAALKVFDPAIRQRADIMTLIEQTYAGTNALPPDIAVPLLDAGYDAQTGAPFSVTERLGIPSLAQVASQRALSPEEVGTLLTFVARALDAGHARQLFHHALKPTNVFVGFAQGFGVRVTDFGAGLPRAAVPTQEGYVLSAPWLAPEQVQGGAAAGAAADVFAAALVAFFALTGRSYWRSCQGAPDLAGWQREIQSPRTPPSVRAREFGVQLSSGFDGVLGASLALDPGQRYRSVGELAAAIESLVAVKGPETAATMAFPSMALGGDYPPPPPPTGGLGTPQPAAGLPAMPPPAPLPPQPTLASAQSQAHPQIPMQMQMPPPQQQPQAPQQGYMAMQQSQQPTQGASDPGRRPTMEVGQMRRQSSSKLAPILVGIAALVLAGGGVAAFIAMGKKSQPHPETVPASAAPATSGGPADSAGAAPTDAPSGEPAPSGSPAEPPGEEVTFACDPGCDEIKVDDKSIDPGKPVASLPPGKHTVTAAKADFKAFSSTITVVAGKKQDVAIKLLPVKVSTGTVSTSTTVAKPKCSRFVKTNCQK
jgi:eukaryotic-like serine/threonine-protein kinase